MMTPPQMQGPPDAGADAPRPFLTRLTDEDRAGLLARAREVKFAAGEELLSAEDGDTDVFVLLEGRAEVILISADGKPVSYRDAVAGDMVGEMAAIDGAPRSAGVVARDAVLAGRLTRADLLAALAESPELALAMMRHLAAQVRLTTARVFEVSTLLARERLVRELMRLGRRAGISDDAALISPAPTHFDLAARVSTHREAVSREMSRLSRLGLVKRKGRELHLPSLTKLAAQIGED